MAVIISDGCRAGFISGLGFRGMFNGGVVDVFTGLPPESANHPVTGTLVAQITALSGLQFENIGPWAQKSPLQTWMMTGVGSGVAGWWRLRGPNYDAGGVSSTAPRIDGRCYSSAAPDVGFVLPALSITPATLREVTQFLFTF